MCIPWFRLKGVGGSERFSKETEKESEAINLACLLWSILWSRILFLNFRILLEMVITLNQKKAGDKDFMDKQSSPKEMVLPS